MGQIHAAAALWLTALIVLHAAAALWPQGVRREEFLRRMGFGRHR